jgi:hypothetical protein
VITDSEERVLNIDHLPPIGDITTAHCVLAWRFAVGKSSREDFKKRKCWNKGDYEGMSKQIECIEWESILYAPDFDLCYDRFLAEYQRLCDEFIPLARISDKSRPR